MKLLRIHAAVRSRVSIIRLRQLALVPALLIPALSGCAKMTLSHQAMALNKTVHNHRVDQLLLNVVRASRYEPMAMTTIGSFVQRNTDTRKAGLGFNFGYLSSDLYEADVSAEYKQSPEMTMTILDNQKEFIDGFMKPISGETIAFFVKQGWNMQFLAYLVVEAIEVPYEDFNPADRAEIRERYPSRIRRNTEGTEFIRIPNDPNDDDDAFDRMIIKNIDRMEIREIQASGGQVMEKFVIPGVRAELVIRSPQGVLSYLGELARMSLKDSARDRIPKIGKDQEPLFHIVRHAKHPGNAEVSVLHRGSFYSIPNNPPSRSMASLNLVQQLIDLQEKKIDQNPSSIRLLGN
ncbi:MAG: hypothetical protein MI807_19680 [Verrucomicrobiales bacterium]|nr:hypothetical protein [Verrucomicrobiales bacterium]